MRFIVPIIGPIGSGKTILTARAKKALAGSGIPFEPTLVTDSNFLVEAIRRDHRDAFGLHHVHGDGQTPRQHPYDPQNEHMTFISADKQIQQWMFEHFFRALEQLKPNGLVHFVEMATGVNGAPRESIGARNNYSNELIVRGLRDGTFPTGWIQRVAGIIHIKSDFSLREEWNNERLRRDYIPGQDVNGDQSRPVPPSVMEFTKGDDFNLLQKFLEGRYGMKGRIVTIENEGTPAFYEQGTKSILDFVTQAGLMEGNRSSTRNRGWR